MQSIGSCPGCRIVVADLCLLSAIKLIIIILTTYSALRIKEGEWMEDIILCGQYRLDHLLQATGVVSIVSISSVAI